MTHTAYIPRTRLLLAASLVLVVCAAGLWWRLGYLGLIDPDEPFYAESSREMLAAGDWVVPRIFDRPQFEKPAFIYWLSMGSMRVFGDTEFAARVPAALFATLVALLALAFGVRAFGFRAGLLGALSLGTCVEFLITGRMVLTDMMLTAFLCASVFSLWMAAQPGAQRTRWFLVACAASGLAALTKGPLGVLVPGFAAIALYASGFRPFPRSLPAILVGTALFALIAVPWYAAMLSRFGRTYADAFFIHENVERFFHAEHPSNNRVYYYLGVLAIGFAPWLPVLPAVFHRAWKALKADATVRFLVIWSLLSLLFFTLAASKLPTYVLFLFVPLALLTGRSLHAMLSEGAARWEVWTAAALGLLQAAALVAAPRIGHVPAFALPLGLVAAVLVAAALGVAFRRWAGWVALSALAGLGVPLLCLGLAGPAIDGIVSVRDLSRTITRTAPRSEPVLASPILVRGIAYYTRRPVTVLSGRAQPFYTPHPLPVVVGGAGLGRYVSRRGAVVCGTTERDWSRFSRGLTPGEHAVEDTMGDKVLARVTPAARRDEEPAE